MQVWFNMGPSCFHNGMKPGFESVYDIPEGLFVDCVDLALDGSLQRVHIVWLVTIDFIFEIAPKKEVAGVQVWTVWWPVYPPHRASWGSQAREHGL